MKSMEWFLKVISANNTEIACFIIYFNVIIVIVFVYNFIIIAGRIFPLGFSSSFLANGAPLWN